MKTISLLVRFLLLGFAIAAAVAYFQIRRTQTTPTRREVFVPPPPVQMPAEGKLQAGKPQTYAEALAQAKAADKPMILFFHADWCAPCQQMEKTIAKQQVQKALEKFVFCQIDIDDEKDLSRQYKIKLLPTLMMVSPAEMPVVRHEGSMSLEECLRWLEFN